ncbi:MAG: Mu transposase C-terminal domain-containing protein [Candidatus Cloacimonadaceae bacterium]|nr:Mu transposase C-terminal domain-containing protein [Candidatus Cloacimonadaceae bacterium]
MDFCAADKRANPALICVQANLPVPAIARKSRFPSRQAESLAVLKALLCDDVLRVQGAGRFSRRQAITQVLALYRNGLTHRRLSALKGDLSSSTVYQWLQKYDGKDHLRLAVNYPRQRGHLVLEDDLSFLTGYMMSSSDRKVQSGLRLLHYWNRRQGRDMLTSDRTLTRAFAAWKTTNHAIYALNRYGEKYVREHLLPMEELDWSLVKQGELWMSDGHRLNFPVLNPLTGKAERPVLVSWFDVAPRMPVGFDLDFTENKRVIGSSFKNGLMSAQYCPCYVKLDNGLGYRSKDISKRLSKAELDELEEDERIAELQISGALYRCGVKKVSFGIPYNSTSKAILERWHGILDNGIESLCPQYSGNSVANKPARMSRNEKFLQRIEAGSALTVIEAKLLIEEWILEVYGQEPHRGIGGRRPMEVFTEGLAEIPAEQRKSAAEFYWLMLSTEVKKLDHNGVKVNGIKYWDEAMVDYVGQQVSVRYEQMDDRFVYVFRSDGFLICRAEARELSDPLATMREDGGLKAMELTGRIKQTRGIMKRLKKATEAHKQLSFQSDDLLQTMIQSGRRLQLTQQSGVTPAVAPAALLVVPPVTPDGEVESADEAIREIYKRLGLESTK